MGYVLVKANGENASGGVAVNTGGGASFLLPMNQSKYSPAGMAEKYSERAARAGEPWARLGEMAAIGGGIYGGLNALNESLASGQGGGLLNDVGMGAYSGYATMSPVSGWAGERAARRFHESEQAEQEKEAQKHRSRQEGMADPTQGQRDRTGALKPQFNIPAGGDMSSFWGASDQTQREFDNRSRYGYNKPTPQPWNLVPGGYVPPPTGAGSTQMNLFDAPVGAGEGAAPFDPENNPAHQPVTDLTSSSVGVRQSGNPDDEMIEGLKRRRLDY